LELGSGINPKIHNIIKMKRQLTIKELMSGNKLSKTTTVVNDNSESNGECCNTVIQPLQLHAESDGQPTTDIQTQLDSSARDMTQLKLDCACQFQLQVVSEASVYRTASR